MIVPFVELEKLCCFLAIDSENAKEK